LIDIRAIKERTDAVEEILTSSDAKMGRFRGLLIGLPDLEKGLCRVHYNRVRMAHLCFAALGWCSYSAPQRNLSASSSLLRGLLRFLKSVQALRVQLSNQNCSMKLPPPFHPFNVQRVGFLGKSIKIKRERARRKICSGMMTFSLRSKIAKMWVAHIRALWKQGWFTLSLCQCVAAVEFDLEEHLKEARKILKKPSMQYVQIGLEEYLFEVVWLGFI
jgi:DNA mismatch repair protein MSH3